MIAEPPVLAAGAELVAGYRVLDHLHRGSDLDVYEVWSDERECQCIAKLPRPDRLDHVGVRRRLITEGRLLRRFTHPHIVRAFATFAEPAPIVILETLQGATVAHLAASRRRRLAWPDLAHLALHLCSALTYLHRQGYLHLDLKPSNVVADRGIAKVLDLSLARRPGRCPRGLGTRPYMSPEQALGQRVGPSADVWGLGVVLFEAASGEPPFHASGTSSTGYGQLDGPAESILRHRRLPGGLAELIDGCLEPDAADRPELPDVMRVLNGLV